MTCKFSNIRVFIFARRSIYSTPLQFWRGTVQTEVTTFVKASTQETAAFEWGAKIYLKAAVLCTCYLEADQATIHGTRIQVNTHQLRCLKEGKKVEGKGKTTEVKLD